MKNKEITNEVRNVIRHRNVDKKKKSDSGRILIKVSIRKSDSLKKRWKETNLNRKKVLLNVL